MKKDILFLCQFFYPEYVSSATLPFDTALALTRAGYSVEALCGYPQEFYQGAAVPEEETVQGIHIRRLRYRAMDRGSKLGRIASYLSFTGTVLRRLGSFSGYRAVIVYSNPPLLPFAAYLSKKLFGCKLIFVAYDLYPEIAERTHVIRSGSMMARVMQFINRRVYRNADRVVTLSQEMRDFICANRPVSGDRVAVIPNWYRDEGVSRPISPESPFYRMAQEQFVVGYFGNLGTAQDLDTLLGAIRLLKDDASVHFLFAGNGNKMPVLKEAVQQEKLENVTVHAFLHGQDFQDALSASGCAVVSLAPGLTGLCSPSKTYSYMMKGLPLLVIMGESDVARAAQSGAGVCIANGDSAGLAAAICRLRDDPALVARMRQTCRRLYEQDYTPETAAQRYTALMQGLLKKE